MVVACAVYEGKAVDDLWIRTVFKGWSWKVDIAYVTVGCH